VDVRGKLTIWDGSGRKGVSVFGAVLAALLVSVSAASATPVVSATALFRPIAGIPHTGNILGAGAQFHVGLTIAGDEYEGHPAPLTAVDLYLPQGATLHAPGFPTCLVAELEEHEPTKCPRGSDAGAGGAVTDTIFPGEGMPAPEEARIESFFTPEGLAFYLTGHSPSVIEALATGAWLPPAVETHFGPELAIAVPPIETASHAGPGSTTELALNIGAAFKRTSETGAKQTIPYLRVPKRCPIGGQLMKAELSFAAVPGQAASIVTTEARMTCPPRRVVSTPPVEAPPTEATQVPGTGGAVTAPPSQSCVSRRKFQIHIQQIKGIKYRRASVFVNGRRVAVVKHGRFDATVDLTGLPKGRYLVKIVVITTTGRRLTGVRAYHACAATPLPGGKPPL
jgi:hypothetical protein